MLAREKTKTMLWTTDAVGRGEIKMEDLLQFVDEDKREQFSEIAKGYIKTDPELVSEFVKSNQSLYDKLLEKPLKTREQNLRDIEFPRMLKEEREKLLSEINPQETPIERKVRELEEKLAEKERKEAEYERKSFLREQYKDIAPNVAEKLYKLDDESVNAVIDYIEQLKAEVDELKKSQKYVGAAPTGGGQGTSLDFASMAIDEVTAFVKKSPENSKVYNEWLKKKK